jgi:hypothetical protein
MLLTFAEPSLAAPRRRVDRRSRGPDVSAPYSYSIRVPTTSSAQLGDQLDHRLVAVGPVEAVEGRVPGGAHEVHHPPSELVRRHPFEEAGERQGDALETQLVEGPCVVAEHGVEGRLLPQTGIDLDGPGERVDEEVVLDVRRALAPQRAVVVQARQPLVERDGRGPGEEVDEGVTHGAVAPRREQRAREVHHRRVLAPGPGGRTERHPTGGGPPHPR